MTNDNTINFTIKNLQQLKSPASGRDYYKDSGEKGLQLSITSKGTITFFLRKKLNGKAERIIIGHFPDLTIEQARKNCAKLKGQIAEGKNPQEERGQIKKDVTLLNLLEEFLTRYAKKHKKTWTYDDITVRKYSHYLLHKKALTITKQDIQKLHEKVGTENGKTQANRLVAILSSIFNKSIDWGWKGGNPCTGVKKFKEKSRDRFLSADEISRFFKALTEVESRNTADYILISLLTGARRSNVLSMKWQDINLDSKSWKIPETKNGDSHTAALSDYAIEILTQRKNDAKPDAIFVFPAQSKVGHLTEPKRTWKTLLKKATITDLRIHDLRRTLASWQAATGANSYIIGKSLGHKSQAATAIYARLNLDPVRESVEKATEAMLKNIK